MWPRGTARWRNGITSVALDSLERNIGAALGKASAAESLVVGRPKNLRLVIFLLTLDSVRDNLP